ncbi:MAG: hypothetical protein IJ318_00445 [Clostridia bacterium]|nr:hypothetical protein [Clostridia bacterium]
MEFFLYNANCPVDYVGRFNLAFGSISAERIEDEEPLVLNPKSIKLFLAKLKECKSLYKALISKFDKLEPHEKLTLLKKFYEINFNELQYYQLKKYGEQFPVSKQIKTTMFIGRSGKFYHALATVYAKNGVKFGMFKTYTKEELCKLISEGKIVIVDALPYGSKTLDSCSPSDVLHYEVLASEFKDEMIDEYTIKTLQEKNPEALQALLGDVTAQQLSHDYETLFLPTYKKMLDFLVKSARVSVAHNKALERNLQKQRTKALEEVREIEEIEKQIIDTSKGR